jgi:hypothetical protein
MVSLQIFSQTREELKFCQQFGDIEKNLKVLNAIGYEALVHGELIIVFSIATMKHRYHLIQRYNTICLFVSL